MCDMMDSKRRAIIKAQCKTWPHSTCKSCDLCYLTLQTAWFSIMNIFNKLCTCYFGAYYGASETVHQILSWWLGLATAGHCGTGSHATFGCAFNFQIHGHCDCARRASALPRRSTLAAHFPRMSTEHGWTLGNSFRKLGLLLIVRTRDKRMMTLWVMPGLD